MSYPIISQVFQPMPKMARLSRECVITEKIDGSNASIFIGPEGEADVFLVGSRTRWITPENDNYGFARWALDHKEELLKLGPGHHFGEWWGAGIQRRYGLSEKRFSLFNVGRWTDPRQHPLGAKLLLGQDICPACCHVVPVLYRGNFYQGAWDDAIVHLTIHGSIAAPGFRNAEGIVVYHEAGKVGFKKTIVNDEKPKSHTV